MFRQKLLSTVFCVLCLPSVAFAQNVSVEILGISPTVDHAQFAEIAENVLGDFRGGWICAEVKDTKNTSCVSNTSDIETLDKTDDIFALMVGDDFQTLVVSCGVFDACENFGTDALNTAFSKGDISFPTENARLLMDGDNSVVEFEGGAFIVDVETGYVKLSAAINAPPVD